MMINKKEWCKCNFLDDFRKVMSNNCALCFNRTKFVIIPSHVEVPCPNQ